MMKHYQSSFLITILFVGFACADSGDDFSNNLFSDLAPVLALFGEQVTMQFMSQSLGIADCILLAMAPLGIITIIVSAIRVGGPIWLQAIIGRARENLSVAEMELMSSTSEDVCELYNGETIVRCQGTAPIWEFICLFPKDFRDRILRGDYPKVESMTLGEAVERKLLKKRPHEMRANNTSTTSDEKPEHDKQAQTNINTDLDDCLIIIRDTSPASPNISLNRRNETNRLEIYFVAAVGIILQLGILVFFGFITYDTKIAHRFQKNGRAVQNYAFPLTATGTILLVFGLFICAYVVDNSTEECYYKPHVERTAQLVWLQQEQTVSDQVFKSFATFPKSASSEITTSRRKLSDPRGTGHENTRLLIDWGLKTKTVIGTAISLAGFILQFIGLRGMNWSATIAQLVVVGIMTTLRAWVRRGLAKDLGFRLLTPNFEIDWLAMSLCNPDDASWSKTPSNSASKATPAPETMQNEESGVSDANSSNHMYTPDVKISGSKLNPVPSNPEISSSDKTDCLGISFWNPKQALCITPSGDKSNDSKNTGMKSNEKNKRDIRISWIVKSGQDQDYHPLESDPAASISQMTLTTRRELSRLADWRGIASLEAVSLAMMIEATMNTLFPPPNNAENNNECFNWPLEVQHTAHTSFGVSRVSIQLWQEGKNWRVLADEIESVLSLWIYSIRKQGSRKNDKLKGFESNPKDDSWIRAEAPQSLLGLRLLGPQEQSLKTQLIQDLKWWVPDGLDDVLEVEKQSDTENAENQQSIEPENSRVVGCGQLISGQESQGGNELNTQTSPLRVNSLVKHENEENKGNISEQKEKKSEVQDGEKSTQNSFLAVTSPDSLEKLYAKDLLYAFMFSAAHKLNKRIPGETETHQTDPKEWKSCILRNKNLEYLAQEFHKNGFGSAHEAYLGMISPFSMANVLPYPQAIFDLAREKVTAGIKEEGLAGASDPYIWLWQQAKCFQSSQNEIWAAAITLLSDYLYQVICEVAIADIELRDDGDELKDVRDQLKKMLTGEEQSKVAFIRLMMLYREQRRPWEELAEEDDEEKPVQNLTQGTTKTIREDCPKWLNITSLHLKVMNDANIDVKDDEKQYDDTKDICGWTPLHYVAARGLVESVETLWIKTYLPNAKFCSPRDVRDWTPLHYACQRGETSIVKFLLRLRYGAKIDAQGLDGVSPWHCAVRSGKLEVVTLLREKEAELKRRKPDFNTSQRLRDYNERAPIHWAVVAGHVNMIEALKADIELQDRNGWTPLHLAVLHNKLDVMEKLIDASANIESVDKIGRTPLILAATKGHWEAFQRLLQLNVVNINAIDVDGYTPLIRAVDYEANEEIVQFLINNGADVHIATTTSPMTVLHYAARRGDVGVMKILLDAFPTTVNVTTEYAETPLWWAINYSRLAMVKLLMERKADPSLVGGSTGENALQRAAEEIRTGGHERKKLFAEIGRVLLNITESLTDDEVSERLDEAIKRLKEKNEE